MALWTNLLLQASNFSDTGSPWVGNASFTVASATSLIPGQTAYSHTNDGAGVRFRHQVIGTLTGSPETLAVLLTNTDATISTISLYDRTIDNHVARAKLTWSTGAVEITSTALGSSVTAGAVEVDAGYLVWVTGTPNNAGNTRWAIVYPSGETTNTETAIIHYAGLHEAATYSPAYIVTGSASVTARVIALDDYPLLPPTRRYQDLATYRRRFDGSMSSTTRSPNATARVWDMETDIMTASETDTLEGELLEPGYVEAVGALIHDTTGVSVECRAQGVERIDGPLDDQARLRFALHEVGA